MIFIILLFFLCGCSEQPQNSLSVYTGTRMTIDYRIMIGDPVKDQEVVKESIDRVFMSVDKIYNKWNSESEISLLNRLPAGIVVRITEELEELLKLSDHLFVVTEGKFDPTVESLEHPNAMGWEKIHFHDRLFYKDDSLTQLDLGGIAKGYCVDLLVRALNDQGYGNVYVEWGGEIKATGQHPEGRPWRIYISNLQNIDSVFAFVELTDQAIATSGDYLQNWQEGERTYFHIVDPKRRQYLQMGEHTIASASVRASSCAVADGLATAAMVFSSLDEVRNWSKQFEGEGIDFWFITR